MTDSAHSSFYPPGLPEGGTIGIVASSRRVQKSWVDAMVRTLEARGYDVVVHDQVYLQNGALAGSDAARAEAINDMFADRTIDAIMCARGGTGAVRILDRLDYELIRSNPKPFVGFSDVTSLLHAISRRTGMVTYHGPMGWNFEAKQFDPRTLEDLLAVISAGKQERVLAFTGLQVERPGRVEGRLIGGNLSLLQCLVGTPFDWSADGEILFIEDIEEPLYRLDRMMAHLRQAGRFEGVKAVIAGEMIDITDEDASTGPYGKDWREIVLDHIPPEIPVVFNFPCGHGRYITTMPVGADVALILADNRAELRFTP